MADRVEALVLQMSADIRKLEAGMAKARATANKNLGDIEKKAVRTNGVLQSVADDIGSGFSKAGADIPVVGSALSAMGPAGFAAAAGIGAAVGALTLIYENAQKARFELDRLGTAAADTGLSAESYQALEAQAIALDVPFEKLIASLGKFQLAVADAAQGQGSLYTALKDTNPALLEQIVTAASQEDRLDALTRAISSQDDQLKKVAISKAAFGKAGGVLVRVFDGEQGLIENITEKYKQMGIVISEDLVTAVGDADMRMELAKKRMDAQATRMAAVWSPTVESLTNAWTDLNIQLGLITTGEAFKSIDDKGIVALQEERKGLQNEYDQYSKYLDASYAGQRGLERKHAIALSQRIAAIDVRLLNLGKATQKGSLSNVEIDNPAECARADVAAAKKAATMAARQDAQFEQLRRRADQAKAELGDNSGLLLRREQDLNELRSAGLLTLDQVNALMIQYQTSLVKVSDAEKDAAAQQQNWLNILASGQTPVEKAQGEISKFWDAVSAGTAGPPAQAAAVLAVLTANLDSAAEAARRATPEFAAIADARKRIADADAAGQTLPQRLLAERQRLNSLVGPAFGQDESNKAFDAYAAEQLAEFRSGTRDSVKEGLREGLTTDDWGAAIRDIIANSIVDGLDSTLNRLSDLLTDLILGVRNAQTGETSGGILNAIGSFFGGFRASGGPVQGGKTYMVGENGPELLKIGAGQSGQVFNASQINGMTSGGGAGGASYVDARITIGGVDMATWPQVRAALAAQAQAITAGMPGAVNATIRDNRRQQRRL